MNRNELAKRLASDILAQARVIKIKRDALAGAAMVLDPPTDLRSSSKIEKLRSARPLMVVPQRHMKLIVNCLVARRR